uniref:Uncharacterized protein n=1 Tax=Geospiza parvula TaxID=87175 RepID=A0A8C3NCL2_GEOPR
CLLPGGAGGAGPGGAGPGWAAAIAREPAWDSGAGGGRRGPCGRQRPVSGGGRGWARPGLGRRPGTAPCGCVRRVPGRADRLCLPPGLTCRRLCAAAAPNLSYQELKDLKKANVLHIDVRERWEIDRFGKIPESINIPLGELMEALQMDPMEFKEQYNQKMPSKSDPVVFSCLAGTRSKQALGFAMSLGFSRVQQYAGGFDDWVKHEPPEKK